MGDDLHPAQQPMKSRRSEVGKSSRPGHSYDPELNPLILRGFTAEWLKVHSVDVLLLRTL